jgi:hypothetical protein
LLLALEAMFPLNFMFVPETIEAPPGLPALAELTSREKSPEGLNI